MHVTQITLIKNYKGSNILHNACKHGNSASSASLSAVTKSTSTKKMTKKKLFKKALKYLNMSKRNGSSASSEFITKYIKEIDIEQDQTHKKNENTADEIMINNY